MSGSRAFASLSSSLLARKGGARPAMRSALSGQTDGRPHDPLGDLGWNDMGDPQVPAETATPATVRGPDPVVAFEPAVPAPPAEPLLARKPVVAEVVQLVREVPAARSAVASAALTAHPGVPAARRTRPAAFTLRLDPDRHFRLRTACALQGRSAQALVTEALDRALDAMPELDSLRPPIPAHRIA